MGSMAPKNDEKMRDIVRMLHKKRRKVRGFGCTEDLKVNCRNVELRKERIEEICSKNPEKVALIVS